jgi:hypothetical protein
MIQPSAMVNVLINRPAYRCRLLLSKGNNNWGLTELGPLNRNRGFGLTQQIARFYQAFEASTSVEVVPG